LNRSPVRDPSSRVRPATYAIVFAVFVAVQILYHWPFLTLPYFWDELGQFVPAALDIFEHGLWVPKSTTPNVHPPGVMAWLAAVWSVTGYSIAATRSAMLFIAGAIVFSAFLLAIELSRPLKGSPALIAVGLLLVSPLFYTQAMMTQLDMPAMLFTLLGLLFYVQQRYVWSAIACVALVLVKETGLIVPAVFGFVSLWNRRWRNAALFTLPAFAVAGWLFVLWRTTGHVFGDQGFTQYNITFQLHPVRLPFTILRRIFYMFVENFHWIGTVAIWFGWKRGLFRSEPWKLTWAVFGLHLFLVSALGGAALERYVLPVLPIFYIAAAAGWSTFQPRMRSVAQLVMIAGLLFGFWWNPPYPFPFENNLAVVDFVKLQQAGAEFVEANYSKRTIYSTWPFSDALRRPEFGFVSQKIASRGVEDFHRKTILGLKDPEVLVVYSRTWEPTWGVMKSPWIEHFLRQYYYYEPQITSREIQEGLGLRAIARWEKRGQWIEVYARPGLSKDNPAVTVSTRDTLPVQILQ
jgi:hypothetical protein